MKNCKQCSKEFEPINYRGTEQSYCSKECRTKAGNERYKKKLMNNGKSEIESNVPRNTQEKQFFSENNNERGRNLFNSYGGISYSEFIRIMEENYNTKNDYRASQLKIEYLEKEIEELKNEIRELEEENEEDPKEKEGIIGMLNDIPEWMTPAIGKLLQSERIVKYIETLVPEKP